MPNHIARLDVHEKMLAFCSGRHRSRREVPLRASAGGHQPRGVALADWLIEREVEEVVMGNDRAVLATGCGRRWSCTGGGGARSAKARPPAPQEPAAYGMAVASALLPPVHKTPFAVQ